MKKHIILFLCFITCNIVLAEKNNTICSGVCGRQATFTLTNDGILRISGEGEMFDYEPSGIQIKPGGTITINPDGTTSGDAFVTYEHQAPWVPYNSQIKSVIVGDSITKIGKYAFYYTPITSATLGRGLKTIGMDAFSYTSLTEIIIPDNVVNLDACAFSNSNIKKIHLGKSLILDEWSSPFNNLQFQNCVPEIITVSPENPTMMVKNNALLSKDGKELVYFPAGAKGIYHTPSGVTKIKKGAFSNSQLSELYISDDVEEIGSGVFSFYQFEKIHFGKNISKVCEYFQSLAYNLREISCDSDNQYLKVIDNVLYCDSGKTLLMVPTMKPGVIDIPEGVDSIADNAFYLCKNITGINFPKSIHGIGEAFTDVTCWLNCAIPENIEYLWTFCGGMQRLTLPESLRRIGNWGIGCNFNNVIHLTMNTTIDDYSTIGYFEVRNLEELQVTRRIPAKISSKTFQGINKSKVTLLVPKGSKEAYQQAEYWNEFTNIEEYSSGDCGNGATYEVSLQGLLTIGGSETISTDNTLSSIAEDITYIEIKPGTENIGANAFRGLSNAKLVSLPSSLRAIGEAAFMGCSDMKSLYVMSQQPATVAPSAFEGIDKSYCTLYVPEGTKAIYKNDATWGQFKNIVEINAFGEIACIKKLSDGIDYCFTDAGHLVIIGDGDMQDIPQPYYEYASASCEEVPYSSFAQKIKEVSFSPGITHISDFAFYNAFYQLKNAYLPHSLKSIGVGAFYGCYKLCSVTLPKSLNEIRSEAFALCYKLKEIYDFSGLASDPNYFFQYSDVAKVHTADEPSIYTKQGDFTFYTHEGEHYLASYEGRLSEPTLPDSFNGEAYNIGDHIFFFYTASYGDNTIINIIIPDGVKSIGNNALHGCNQLKNISIPESVSSIGQGAFSRCDWLTSIKLPSNLRIINRGVFNNCEYLNNIVLPDNIESIDSYAFYGCKSLTSINLPKNLKEIGPSAFELCNSLGIIYNDSPLELTCGSTDNGYVAYYAKAIQDSKGTGRIETDENGCKFYVDQDGATLILSGSVTPNSFHGREYVLGQNLFSLWNYFDFFSGDFPFTISNGVKAFEDGVFENCQALRTLNMPNSVKTLGDACFRNAPILETITLSTNLKSMGKSTFAGCKNLLSVEIPSSLTNLSDETFCECVGLKQVILHDNLTKIGNKAFCGCYSLEELSLPKTVTSIGMDAFASCTAMKKLYAFPQNPAKLNGNVFCDIDKQQCTLYVPKGCKAAYATADGWKDFCNIVEDYYGGENTQYTVEVGESGWTTMMVPFDCEIPSDMEVYCVNDTTSEYQRTVVALNQQSKIIANIPYLVKAPIGSYVLQGNAYAWDTEYSYGLLKGFYCNGTNTNLYALRNEVETCFVKNGECQLSPNMAYLDIDAESDVVYIKGMMQDLGEVICRESWDSWYFGSCKKSYIDSQAICKELGVGSLSDAQIVRIAYTRDGVCITPYESGDWLNADGMVVASDDEENKCAKMEWTKEEPDSICLEYNFWTDDFYVLKLAFIANGKIKIVKAIVKSQRAIKSDFEHVGDLYYTIDVRENGWSPGYYDGSFEFDLEKVKSMLGVERLKSSSDNFISFDTPGVYDENRVNVGYYYSEEDAEEPTIINVYSWNFKTENRKVIYYESSFVANGKEVTIHITANMLPCYKLEMVSDNETVTSLNFCVGDTIPEFYKSADYNRLYKEGFFFNGWEGVPNIMPAHNVESYAIWVKHMKGDPNGDGNIDVADIGTTVQYIVQSSWDTLRGNLADVNENGYPDIGDAYGIANFIMNGEFFASETRAKGASGKLAGDVRMNVACTNDGDVHLTILSESHERNICGIQFELMLPGGLKIKDVRGFDLSTDHAVVYDCPSENTTRFVVYSTSNDVFEAFQKLAQLCIEKDPDMPDGEYVCNLQNVMMVTERGELLRCDTPFIINWNTTGVTVVDANSTSSKESIFDMMGIRRSTLQKGINIINGKKIIKR